ncbi:hypothetical protein ACKUB1_15645 [Methanospirillum stamsii]|uniref:hypothetical protein n=1 Tax=Methanospirillum stamsii TaxID=1277351 RepID=UPI0015E83255|nr:hypothetical protein [Methanospirillum stamsii]
MESEQIKSILEKEGITTEIGCPQAFEISEKYGVSKLEIAKYCNIHDIKIRACQLGCFK